MARKYDLISELYRRTAHAVVSDVQNWQAFLRCACRNYRLRFDEQLLIYAQRPDATAVLEIERWNDKFGRWVNRGAKGIAVFEDADRSRQRLTHYFDISDTHASRYSRPVPIWEMKPEYMDDVIESLENTFGELENRESLADAVLSAAKNAVEDNIPDYLGDLMYAADDSFLYGLSEDMITAMYKKAVTNSVAYMMMTRLGIDTEPFYEAEDFSVITNFNTPETLNALGIASSDIAEMGLGEISRTVLALERQNRIIADREKPDYNKAENKIERSFDDERADIHNAGRLQSAGFDNAAAAGGNFGQVRSDEAEISQRTSQNPLLQSSDELHADGAFSRNRADSTSLGRNPDEADGGAGGLDREPESGGYDEVGAGNEQSEEQSAGDRESGGHLRLDYYDRNNEDKSLPFFGGDDTIREILGTTPHLKASKDEIRAFYEGNPDNADRTEYIKSIFNNDYTEVILSDDRRVGYKTWQNVLQLWEGNYTDRIAQGFYDWGVIAQHFEAMRLLGELQDTRKPLPSMDGQLNFLDMQAEEKTSAFSFSQEIIDTILTRGSGISEGKFRIYEQFEKSLSAKENADFLKDEYGWGGAYPVIVGAGIDEQHDGKGILISKGIGDDKPHIRLTWTQVEKRIKELIRLDRYLNPKEKEIYPQWLEKQEERRAELAEEQRNREILSSAPPEQETVQAAESEPQQEAQYAYHLGDTVYMGADEYEILAFDDKQVRLFDTQFPLFNKEMDRAEFDRRVRENPLNDHLKVKELLPEEKADEAPAFDIGMGYLGNGLTVWNRAVEENGDYQTIAHISNEGEIHYYVDGLPEDVVARIKQAAAQEQQKALFSATYKIGDKVNLDGKPFEITRVDDWNVELMDRSVQNPQPRLEQKDSFMRLVQQNERSSFTDTYREYSEIKEDNPDSLILYQMGDFFEAYGADAQTISEALELNLTSRSIGGNQRTQMCGFPSNRLETYVNMLLDRGFDVAVSSLENGEHNTRNIVSTNKEDPVQSQPVGRIDYLHTDGTVRESVEYTSPYQFEKDIKEETFYGVPFTVIFYKDKDGNTVPQDFIGSLDPQPKGVEIIDSPYLANDRVSQNTLPPDERFFVIETDDGYAIWDDLTEAIYIDNEGVREEFKSEWQANDYLEQVKKSVSELDTAKALIDEYCRDEFEREEGADYTDLSNVELAYTTTEDDKHEIQARVNLVDYRLETLADGKVIRSEQFSSLEDMIERSLQSLSFNDLVYLSDEELEMAEQNSAKQPTPEKNEPLTPAFSQQKRSRVQTFDLHPDIPMSERHTFDLASHEVPEAGKKERFRRNMEAIRVLKECEFDNRFATPEEQEVLSQYVGWGGIPEAFDENNSSWANEFIELYTALSPDEYESARASTLTAFYTPPVVISSIYKAMEQMGFREGNILEPSCGIGNFIGMLPASMQDSKIYGVEIDKISAGIAQQLYQKTSIAAQPFEEATIPDSFFDAVIGNVPFGDIRVNDRRYNKHNFLIHDYFFAKSLDKLRPGGVMALITSKGTMDKENPAVRKYIAQRADLLGAIRLPNNTFKGNAGTEVVSDILILQKRDRLIDLEPEWVHLNTDENGVKMNAYFVDHPEMVLGEWKTVSGRFGEEDTVVPYENADLAELLDEAISNIHAEITDYEVDEELTEEDNSIPADPEVRNFSYTVVDDKIYYRENSRMTPVECSATAENRIKGMIAIRDSVRSLIEMQTADYPDYEVEKEQQKLNALYDTFSKKYGLINSRANVSAFSQDSSFALLSALEVLDENGELERKADMFTKRTIKPHTPVTSVDTASEALAVSMGEKAYVDMEYMCSLTGKTEEEIYQELKGVIFLNPMYGYGDSTEQKYLMADEYLSGNVREKLAWAKNSAEVYPEDYKTNVEALEKVQPKDLTASEIFVQLGTTWLPEEIAQQFMYEFLDTPRYAQWNIKVHYSKLTGEWNVEGKSYDRGNLKAYNTYGTKRVNAYKIIEDTLNMKDVRVFDYMEDDEGKKKAVLNKKETAIAQSKQELIKQGFQDWVWRDPARREKLVRLYNDKFNSIRPREYDGSHIIFSGMNPEISLREHQKNAVAHILYGGNTLLAHAVGAGKTFEMTAAAMESKRLGLCNKSLFVVPNHLTEQWAAEFLQLYPAANILVATKKDFEMKNRKRFCGRIATGDYDAVIIGHSQFEKIPISIERQRAVLQQQLDDIIEGIADIKRNRGDRFSVKQLEKTKKSLQTKLEKLNDQSRKDDVVTFEELGIDRLFIDESHYYKNLYLYTKMRNVGGIAQTEAQKSSDLFMKCRYLDEITGGRGVVFATGTPISNSMVELYTIQRYLQYRTLQEHDLQHFDAWASMFGETVTAVELTPEGTGYRAKTRFAKFNNLPELMAMFKQVADIKTADMLDLPVPEVEYHNIAVKPSQVQKEMVASLGERAEKIRGGNVDSSVDNMLKVTNDGRKLALDQRMMNPMLPDEEGSKVNACVNEIFRIWEENSDKKLTQLLFCDLSTPKGAGEFSVYTDIRQKLIERGIPESEIKFIHEADTETKKQELFKKVRCGEVRILMGSTQKMGAGTNVQNKIIASHDLDCPWRPADLEQRAGRTVRQGNENPKVGLYRYVTEGTFDAYCWQLVEGKQKFASQIMTSKSPVRSCEDVDATALSYAEIKMLAADNPHIKEKMDLDIQVQKLRLLKSNYLSEKYELEDKIIKYYPTTIARTKETIAGLEKDILLAKEHPKPLDDTFVGIEVKGVSYSEKAEGGQKIIDACKEMTSPDPVPLGKYRGFDLELSFDTFEKAYQVKIKGSLSRSVSLGTDAVGNITRIDNAIEKIPERLEAKSRELSTLEQQFATAKAEVEKPFDKEEELTEKTNRLNVLNGLLNVDKRENELVDGAPDEGDSVPTPKERAYER
jgi:N12 class adenine-specific DNA methylase/adenine-specific DNA methylase